MTVSGIAMVFILVTLGGRPSSSSTKREGGQRNGNGRGQYRGRVEWDEERVRKVG